ncbi:hypothetical protein A8H39_01320 [Paraburkholderia fungorum]|uniref:hypothetical protein n=1 Tax=Paraburkholderia fungorum TaxID=134537 RepID=UPI0004842242|nr:hypothetical protein [Paraburkholderia fungorum]PNE59815.1 hypothetical protein A8H39_01320 [Paraburkholderia fungorum]
MSVFEAAQTELRELLALVKQTTEWDMTIACGKVRPEEIADSALLAHRARISRVEALKEKYGL